MTSSNVVMGSVTVIINIVSTHFWRGLEMFELWWSD